MKAPVKLQSQNPEEEVIWGFYAEEYDDLVEFMRGLADRIDLILELNTEPYTNYKHLLR